MAAQRHLYLGIFFLVVLLVLGGYTIFLTDFTLFGERSTVTVYFKNTDGLREGDPVQVAGMRWGQVDALTFDPGAPPERRITARILLDDPLVLREDHSILIQNATLLGGKVLAIEPGSPDMPPVEEDAPLFGRVSPNVLDALGEVVEENREPFRRAVEGLESMVADARAGPSVLHSLVYDPELATELTEAVGGVRRSAENVAEITTQLREGRGTLGRLLMEEGVYSELETIADQLRGVLDEAQGFLGDARGGTGTIAMLLNDEELARDVREAVASIEEIVRSINEGKGTLGMLVNDRQIGENLDRLLTGFASGEGTIGRLMTEDEIYEDLREITAALRAGLTGSDGTLGRLLNDDELYEQLQRAIATMTGALEEAREAAPITTLVNTLFLGF